MTRTRRGVRGSAGVIGALAVLCAVEVQGVAAAVLWTMTASPLTATVGTPTTLTLTATNLDPLLGVKCVVADIPATIAPADVWLAGSSTTADWVVSRSGQQVTAVISTADGNQKLRVGDWVAFAVAGVPVQPGAYAINAVAYSGHECFNGARALAAPPVVVISGALLPPPPEPTPPPPPAPTPTPEPVVVLPSILPTLGPQLPAATARPTPRAAPAAPAAPPTTPGVQAGNATQPPAPSPAATAAAAATSAPTPTAIGSGVASAGPPPTATPDSRPLALPRAEPDEGDMGLTLGQFGAIDGLEVWAIPGAVVGGPGLIVILWVAVQAAVGLAWVPAIRRLRGDGRFGGRVRRT